MTDLDVKFDDSGEVASYRLNGKPVLSAKDEGMLDWLVAGLKPTELEPGKDALAWEWLSEVPMKSVVFLDAPLWQGSAFHLVAGRKGVGKGTALADLAARVTRGELVPKLRVVWIASEDSASIDIGPRVIAAGGDPGKVAILKDWLQLPRDVERLKNMIAEVDQVGLVIIDPVGNHITRKNSNSDTDIRDAISPLNDLADGLETMVVGVRHLSEKEAKAGAIASDPGCLGVGAGAAGDHRDRSRRRRCFRLAHPVRDRQPATAAGVGPQLPDRRRDDP